MYSFVRNIDYNLLWYNISYKWSKYAFQIIYKTWSADITSTPSTVKVVTNFFLSPSLSLSMSLFLCLFLPGGEADILPPQGGGGGPGKTWCVSIFFCYFQLMQTRNADQSQEAEQSGNSSTTNKVYN